jgi:hypothetical protein
MILRDPGARGVSSGVAAVAVLVTAGGSPFRGAEIIVGPALRRKVPWAD